MVPSLPPPSQRNYIPLVLIQLPRDSRPLLTQRLPIPQRSVHGQTLLSKREGHFALEDAPLAMNVRDFAAGVERHGGVFGEEGQHVQVVSDVRHVLRERERVLLAIDARGLQAVEEEDVFVLRGDGEFVRDAVLEVLDEDLRHREERAVVQSAVEAVVLGLLIRVEAVHRPHVAALAEVVPGDQLDEVGPQLQQVQPAVEPHP